MTAPLVGVETSVTGFLPCDGTVHRLLEKGSVECFLPALWTMTCKCPEPHEVIVLCSDCVRDFMEHMHTHPYWVCSDHGVDPLPNPPYEFGELK